MKNNHFLASVVAIAAVAVVLGAPFAVGYSTGLEVGRLGNCEDIPGTALMFVL